MEYFGAGPKDHARPSKIRVHILNQYFCNESSIDRVWLLFGVFGIELSWTLHDRLRFPGHLADVGLD